MIRKFNDYMSLSQGKNYCTVTYNFNQSSHARNKFFKIITPYSINCTRLHGYRTKSYKNFSSQGAYRDATFNLALIPSLK